MAYDDVRPSLELSNAFKDLPVVPVWAGLPNKKDHTSPYQGGLLTCVLSVSYSYMPLEKYFSIPRQSAIPLLP